MIAPIPSSVELHIATNSEFVRKYGAKVKAAGGRYSDVRGYTSKRFVTVPLAARALINAIARSFGVTDGPGRKMTMVARFDGLDSLPSWVSVQHVSPRAEDPCAAFLALYEAAFQEGVKSDAIRPVVTEPPGKTLVEVFGGRPAPLTVAEVRAKLIDGTWGGAEAVDALIVAAYEAAARDIEDDSGISTVHRALAGQRIRALGWKLGGVR